ncbi:MAG: PEP-CTERM sorting domain-containing protein [Verrucomicrobiota bacterium]
MMSQLNCNRAGTKLRTKRLIPALLGLAGFLTLGSTLQAQPLFVPNHSFETPSTWGFPYDTNPFITEWQQIAQPPEYAFLGPGVPPWYGTSGVFSNTSPISVAPYVNVSGNQAGYILMAPKVTLFQDYSVSPTFTSTYEIGKSYNLTLGLFARSSLATIVPGSTLELSLYYLDGSNSKVKVGSTVVSYSTAAFPSSPTPSLIDYQVNTLTVNAGDAWVGKNIGIQLESTIPLEMTSFGNWDFDNVRLTAVPEPTTIALLGIGLGSLILARSRRQS